MIERRLRIGLVVNPYAGIGGPSARKGSDDPELKSRAQAGELTLRAGERVNIFIRRLQDKLRGRESVVTFVTVAGPMGANYIKTEPFAVQLLASEFPDPSTAQHTQIAVAQLQQHNIDLLVFVGGDGTARDVCAVVNEHQVVLGIPSGVKMHSGVFAVTPQAAADLVVLWLGGEFIGVQKQEVRDIDEEQFRQGRVVSQFYGEMLTPEQGQFVQRVKQGGFEVEEMVIADIAADLQERIEDHALLIWGPGSTTWNIAQNWGIQTTLLGVDLIVDGTCSAVDVDMATISQAVAQHRGPVYVVVTAIGGQGHIIGRGNQQISCEILKNIGRDHLLVVATKTKLRSLQGRPMIMDSGDAGLDYDWRGYISVICGYHDLVLYALGYDHDQS